MRLLVPVALSISLFAASCGNDGAPSPAGPAPAASPSPVTSADGWVGLPGSPLSPGTGRHDDVFFLDPSNGWLINIRGEVHRTRDGGGTWEFMAMFSWPARCLGFVSLLRGWAGNINVTSATQAGAALWETEDGGRTWSNVSPRIEGAPTVGLCGMRVLTSDVVVAVGRWNGPPVFVKTSDGGRRWTSRNVAPLASGLVDLFFFNERDGFAVGGLGVGSSEAEQRASRTVILATADGGETWQTRYTSAGVGQWAWKIHFVTDRVGYVTTEGPSPDGAVLKTTDGGASWRPQPVAAGQSFEGVGFVTADRGWVGSGQTLYATGDGGATWRPLQFAPRINRIRVLGDSLAYACGDRVYRWTP